MGVIQEITLLVSQASIAALNRQLDEASRDLQHTIEKAIDAGGADSKAKAAAVAKIRALKDELDRESRALSAAVEQGLLGAKEAAVLGMDAGRAYGEALSKELTRIQQQGVLTKTDLAVIAKQTGQATGLGKSLFDIAPPDETPFRGFFDHIKGMALGVGGAIAGVFALSKLKAFALDSVREFLKDANDLDNLRSAVQGLGGDFEQLRPQIDTAADAFVKAGRGSAGDYQRILTQLILTSGDYQKSLGNVTLVSDLAAARQISLQQATKLVGSAMDGQAGRLKQFGIHVAEGADAVQALRDQVGGFVERQGPTWTRATTAASSAWSELKSRIGEAILTAAGGTSTFDSLTTMVQALTTIVRENAGAFTAVGSAIAQVASFLAEDLVSSVRQAIQDITNMGAAWLKLEAGYARFEATLSRIGSKISYLRGDVATALEQELEAKRLDTHAADLDARSAAAKARADREEAVNRGARLLAGTESGASSTAPSAMLPPKKDGGGDNTDGATRTRKPDFGTIQPERVAFRSDKDIPGLLKALGFSDETIQLLMAAEDRKAQKANLQEATSILDIRRAPLVPLKGDEYHDELQEKVEGGFQKIFGRDFHESVDEASGYIADEFGAVFERLFTDGENLQQLFANLGKGLASGLIKEIAQLAQYKARENIAKAIEETAEGVAALFLKPHEAAAHFKSAALHTAAAAAWGVLGGAASAAGGGLSQAGGGGGSSLGAGQNERLQPGGRGTATLIINGGDILNLGDRRTLDQLAKGLELLSGYNVVIKRSS